MKDFFRYAVVAVSLLFAASAFAQHQTFTVDPNASQVAWALGGSGHHVNGTFHLQSGLRSGSSPHPTQELGGVGSYSDCNRAPIP